MDDRYDAGEQEVTGGLPGEAPLAGEHDGAEQAGTERARTERAGGEGAAIEHPTRSFPSSNIARPRIEGVEAGVAAGLVPATRGAGGRRIPGAGPTDPQASGRGPASVLYEEPVPEEIAVGVELPDWTDPPTGEVPAVLLRAGLPTSPGVRGPVWRESQRDFDEDSEAFSEIVSGSVPVVPHEEAGEDDSFGFDFDFELTGAEAAVGPAGGTLTEAVPEVGAGTGGEAAPATSGEIVGVAGVRFAGRVPVRARAAAGAGAEAGAGAATGAGAEKAGGAAVVEAPGEAAKVEAAESQAEHRRRGGRNPLVATVTGLLVGAVALLCFHEGAVATLVISCVVLTLAAAEWFQSLRRARYLPATLLGLVATPCFAIAAYLKGEEAIPIVFALAFVGTLCWYLVGASRRSVVPNIAVTWLGIAWVAGLGAFAGLLLDPAAFPLGHGVAYLLGAVEATVAYDVGAYAFGSLLGRHRLAPSISPNKTWEGLIGGSASAIVVALLVTAQMSPWSLPRAAALGVVVAVMAPLGDFAESLVKRDLKLKDMGSLLPAHGGVLDRVDALLFVLPATYVLVRLFHG